jgi:hypothetical protein
VNETWRRRSYKPLRHTAAMAQTAMKGHGNAAADALRAQSGQRAREAMFAASEQERERMRAETSAYRVGATDQKFTGTTTATDSQLSQATVGLVSKAEFARRRQAIEDAEARVISAALDAGPSAADGGGDKKKKKKKADKAGALSFAMDDENETAAGAEAPLVFKKPRQRSVGAEEGGGLQETVAAVAPPPGLGGAGGGSGDALKGAGAPASVSG